MGRHWRRFAVAFCVVGAVASPALADPAAVRDCGVQRAEQEWRANPALEACAARGEARAMAYLGMLYWGESQSTDISSNGLDPKLTAEQLRAEGARLLVGAAEQNDHLAQNELGLAYFEGRYGLPIDEAEALRLFESAAAQGDEVAEYNLARVHFSGRGVPASNVEAERLLRSSAERGYRPARCALATWLDRRDDPPSRAEARGLRQQAARENYGYGCAADESAMDEMPPRS
jgi:TPR repeat protein